MRASSQSINAQLCVSLFKIMMIVHDGKTE